MIQACICAKPDPVPVRTRGPQAVVMRCGTCDGSIVDTDYEDDRLWWAAQRAQERLEDGTL